jgi:hypothetical protein
MRNSTLRQARGFRLPTPALSSFEEERENPFVGRKPRAGACARPPVHQPWANFRSALTRSLPLTRPSRAFGFRAGALSESPTRGFTPGCHVSGLQPFRNQRSSYPGFKDRCRGGVQSSGAGLGCRSACFPTGPKNFVLHPAELRFHFVISSRERFGLDCANNSRISEHRTLKNLCEN